jgi:RNA polymerase sigma factor (sigma-70 family)
VRTALSQNGDTCVKLLPMHVSPDVLRRASEGDDAAWREIVSHYQRLVYATIRSFRVPSEDAEDLFQETFLRLHRHAAGLRDTRALTRWLVVTARHLCLDHLERARVRGQSEHAQPSSVMEGTPLTDFLLLERAQWVREAILELPPRCRDLLWMLYFEQETPDYEAAARAFGMPLGSVGPTRMRCLEQLLRLLRRRGIES